MEKVYWNWQNWIEDYHTIFFYW